MHLLAGTSPLYSSAVFDWVTGIAVTLILGVLGVWAAFKAANPRQELAWQVRAIVPLLSDAASHQVRDTVQIRVDGQVLQSAQVVELYLINRGRRDIPTEAFDQKRPLRIDVGASIVKVLNRVDSPGVRPPQITSEDSALTLGPDLFKRGQAVSVSLLVDGSEPTVTIPESPFIDIAVLELPAVNGQPAFTGPWNTAAAAVVAAAFGLVAGAVGLVAVMLVAVVVATSSSTRRRRRPR